MTKIIAVGDRATETRPLFKERVQNALIAASLNAPEYAGILGIATAATFIGSAALGTALPSVDALAGLWMGGGAALLGASALKGFAETPHEEPQVEKTRNKHKI